MFKIQSILNVRIENVAITFLIIFACFPIIPINILVDSDIRIWATRISYIVAIILALVSLRRFPVSAVCAFVYGSIIIFSAYLNRTNISEAIAITYPMVGLSLLMEWGICNKGTNYLIIVERIFYFAIVLTFILYPFSNILFGEGDFLIGGENHIILPTLAASALSLIRYSLQKCSKRHVVVNYVICTALTLVNFSGGGVVAWLVYSILFLLLSSQKKFEHVFTLAKMSLMYVLAWWGVVILRIQNFFSWFIEDILGKSLTLTHRTEIWDQVLSRLQGNYVFGFGPQETTNLFTINGNYDSGQSYSLTLSSHNCLLQTIYTGGIISIIPLAILLIISSRRLLSVNSKLTRNAIVCWIAGIFAMMLVEATGVIQIIFPLSIACAIPILVEKSNSDNRVPFD